MRTEWSHNLVTHVETVLQLACTMAQSQSSLAGDCTLNGSNHPGSAAYADAATQEDESFMLSGTEMATNIMKVKIASPFTTDDHVN